MLKEINRRHPKLPVIMVTADNDVRRAVEVTKLGHRPQRHVDAVDLRRPTPDAQEHLEPERDRLVGGRVGRGVVDPDREVLTAER